ncbi:MAG: mechanosensitive ion channel family protein [Thiohalocapsa sp.]|uniref:mechanosensitive ion channel domain-containing protein n=1 Tax=Thiohalocapsa sp. TaxID=2497641 RepID=UPI0025F4C5BF|nr:mechanosensitive ion channel family protein [Thiohalocapsa sp.]MCG6940483.1 mechanosensitive ion channel family protein [Thiohalocapsa sp.]
MIPASARRVLPALGLSIVVLAPLVALPGATTGAAPVPQSSEPNSASSSASSPASSPAEGAAPAGAGAAQAGGHAAAPKQHTAAASEPQLGFDPALVGLKGFPETLSKPAAFETAIRLIDARLDELRSAPSQAPSAGAGTAAAIAASGAAAETPAAKALAAETGQPAAGPRIKALEGLRQALRGDAALHQRLDDVRKALAQQDENLKDPAQRAVAGSPPYLITVRDQLLAERASRAIAEAAAERRLDSAQQREQVAADALAAAVRARRAARDQLQQAEDKSGKASAAASGKESGAQGAAAPGVAELARALEVARLHQLQARVHDDAAQTRVSVAQAEADLAAADQRLLGAKLEQVDDHVVLTKAMLDKQLAGLEDRAATLRDSLQRLQRMGDAAESALYQARRQQAQAKGANANGSLDVLDAWVDARMAQATAARKGAEYVQQTLDDLAAMERLWHRRYTVLTDPKSADLTGWLREAKQNLASLREDQDYVESELNALRDMALKLQGQLSDPGLTAALRAPLQVRQAALTEQESDAGTLLATHDERRALLERLTEQLDPLVSARSLQMRIHQALAWLGHRWSAELFVVEDQSISVRDIAVTLGIFLLVLALADLAKRVLRRVLRRRRARGEREPRGKWGLLLDALVEQTSPLVVLIAAFALALALSGLVRPQFRAWLWNVLVVALYVQVGLWVNGALTDYLVRKRSRKEQKDPSTVTGYGLLLFFAKVSVWIIVGISVLAYFKYPLAGLVGALGVGGVAVAFAVQNILGDVFNSMAIILDKPFRVGDFIVAGDALGVIENIGVKTTRIRSLSGEQVVISNTDLLKSRIHNYKHMRERRVVFRLGVTYETPREKLKRIPGLIETSIREQSRARFDRAHFAEYGDYALAFEAVYYVLGADYTIYMDVQQAIYFALHERFEAEGIDFAYPTREIIVRRPDAAEAPVASARAD